MQNKQMQPELCIHSIEEILVVKRSKFFEQTTPWQGLNKINFKSFVKIIQSNGLFIPRAHAETNPAYKQIIPYLIFSVEDKFFVMERKSTASESRLASKLSLGIGGHIRKEDITNNNVFEWAKREFHEEVSYNGSFTISEVGILNDDSTEVGKVHVGLIMIIKANSDKISIKDEHKSGTLLTRKECEDLLPKMEPWSQMILKSI